jgi:ATP-dependent Lon protease
MSENQEKLEKNQDVPEGPGADIPEVLPLLPIRDMVVFPYMIVPLIVGRDASGTDQ